MADRLTILIVEDQDTNRKLLKHLFRDRYDTLEAADGEAAIDILNKQIDEIAIVLLDIVMPKVDGFGVLEYMTSHEMIEKVPVVLITGETSVESKDRAFTYGASDVVEKPYDANIIRKRIANLVDLWEHKRDLEHLIEKQNRKIQEQNKELKEVNYHIVDTLGSIAEFRNLDTIHHVNHVREFTRILAKCLAECYPEYKLTLTDIEQISYASVLHDVGKIQIPDRILNKPGSLTDDEYEIMKGHTLYGAEIIERITAPSNQVYMRYSKEIARSHHERYDGSGYPDGLVGDAIPISAQIVSITDAYDTLCDERLYKAAYTPNQAYTMIMNGDCGVFNPKLLMCLRIVHSQFDQYLQAEEAVDEALAEAQLSARLLAREAETAAAAVAEPQKNTESPKILP